MREDGEKIPRVTDGHDSIIVVVRHASFTNNESNGSQGGVALKQLFVWFSFFLILPTVSTSDQKKTSPSGCLVRTTNEGNASAEHLL